MYRDVILPMTVLRRFNEENNEEAGEYWPPRDPVRLMANLDFLPVADESRADLLALENEAGRLMGEIPGEARP